jgi:HEAT repeat protein
MADGRLVNNGEPDTVTVSDDTSLVVQLSGLRSASVDARRRAAFELGRIGNTTAVTALAEAVGDTDSAVRNSAIGAIGKIGGAEAVQALIAALTNADDSVRAHAATALGNIGDLGAVSQLIAALGDCDCSVRAMAAAALGKLKAESAVAPLVNCLRDTDIFVVQQTVEALARIGDDAAVAALCNELQESVMIYEAGTDNDPPQQLTTRNSGRLYLADLRCKYIAQSLGSLRFPTAVPFLVRASESASSIIRARAIRALGRVGDATVIRALVRALGDPHSDVSSAATAALDDVGDSYTLPIKVLTCSSLTAEDRHEMLQALSGIRHGIGTMKAGHPVGIEEFCKLVLSDSTQSAAAHEGAVVVLEVALRQSQSRTLIRSSSVSADGSDLPRPAGVDANAAHPSEHLRPSNPPTN